METATLSPKITALVHDAHSAGFTISRNGNIVDFVKGRNPANHSLPNRGVRLFLNEGGGFFEAHRLDVPLDCVTTIRTIKLTREVLGL